MKRMSLSFAFTFLAFQIVFSGEAGSFMWRPETISLTVQFRDKTERAGQYILLENALREGETGWKMSKMAVPDSWRISDLQLQDRMMTFKIQTGEFFRIGPPRLNELDFKLLDGGEKSQREIESLWRQYAKE